MHDGPAMVLLFFGGPYFSPNADSISAFEKKVQGSTSRLATGAWKRHAGPTMSGSVADRMRKLLVVDRGRLRSLASQRATALAIVPAARSIIGVSRSCPSDDAFAFMLSFATTPPSIDSRRQSSVSSS